MSRGGWVRADLRSLRVPRFGEDPYPVPFLASPLGQVLSLLLVGATSGFLLKQQQLRAVSDSLAAVYPFSARLPFVLLEIAGTICGFALNSALISLALRMPFFRATARLGETYGLLAAAYVFGPLSRFWLYPLLLLVINGRAVFGHGDRQRARAWVIEHRGAFGWMAAIVAIYAVFLAPLLDPLIAIVQVDRFQQIIPFSLATTMRSTLPAVAGLQEPSWHPTLSLGGGSFRPEMVALQNYLLSAIFSILPISSADVVGIFQLEKAAVFLVFCLGGVGYYLFCRYGLRLRPATSFLVGVVVVMSDGILARHYEVDWGYASCAVPVVLLAVMRAREASSLWLFALAGGVAGIFQNLHFTHPEVVLSLMYFVIGWIVWDYGLTVPQGATKAQHLRMLAAVPVFGASSLLANYRFLGGLLEFSGDGNQITSERLLDYGVHGPAVVARNLLGPLGLQGSGPFKEPYLPYYYGLLVACLIVLGVLRLVRTWRPRGATAPTMLSFAIVGPLLLGALSLYGSSLVGALYAIGAPAFPFHTGVRVVHPVHACLMVLLAFGLEETLAIGDQSNAIVDRNLALKVLGVFLVLVMVSGPQDAAADLHRLQILFAAVTLMACWFVHMPRRLRLILLGTMLVVTALMSTRSFTMIMGAAYHKNVVAKSRLGNKIGSNTLPARLLHPEDFSRKVYPLSLRTMLRPAREDLANPRTKLYVWRLMHRFRSDLGDLIKFRRRGGLEGPEPTLDEATGAVTALAALIKQTDSYGGIDDGRLDRLLELSGIYDRLYRAEQGAGLNELDQIIASLNPSERYPRVAYSNAFKAKAGGDALNDFPTFESSHYYVMGAANLRWPSTLDYFFTDVGKAISESIYYEGNMFPPVSRSYLDLLGFDYLIALDAEIADLRTGSDVLGKVGPATILHNKQALPRAALFRRAKVIAPLRYNDLNFNSKARIDQGRAALNAIDTKTELLIEAGPSFEFRSEAGAAASAPQAVNIVRIANNFAVFKVHNPGADALLFYSDAYHPDWRAYVDKARRKVVRADLGFKAVVVPPGDHLVWMEFVPVRAELARGLVLLLAACLFMQVARTAENRRSRLAVHNVES